MTAETKNNNENIGISTGMPKSDQQRWHFDIYAVLEGAQELYFGHDVEINLSVVELVKIPDSNGLPMEKCYISPTKRRGVERRSLLWAPVANGRFLGDEYECGIPNTCAKLECPVCSVYGALITRKMTFVGRLVHGGGVAIQELDPEEKQRAMHPSMLHKKPDEKPTPTPFKRQYNQPGLLYPVYNHCLSITDAEFNTVAYAFLDSLSRLGAGNPKGVKIYEEDIGFGQIEPLLVVDRYLAPLGKRPVVSPSLTDVKTAIEQFRQAARNVEGEVQDAAVVQKNNFTRWLGNAALIELQKRSADFVSAHLTEDE